MPPRQALVVRRSDTKRVLGDLGRRRAVLGTVFTFRLRQGTATAGIISIASSSVIRLTPTSATETHSSPTRLAYAAIRLAMRGVFLAHLLTLFIIHVKIYDDK